MAGDEGTVTLTEWLNARLDVGAAEHDADCSTENVVEVNQRSLAALYAAVMMIDNRLSEIEATLGFDPFQVIEKR